MIHNKKLPQKTLYHFLSTLILLLISTVLQANPHPIGKLRLIDTYILPKGIKIDNIPLGGLSGIDYDKAQSDWVIISDDKAEYGPVRFYRAQINYDLHHIQHVTIASQVMLKNEKQQLYNNKHGFVPDAEAIRVDPVDSSLWWIGEGYIPKGSYPKMVNSPTIFHSRVKGELLTSLPTLANLEASSKAKIGPRHNKGLEGLSFSADGQTLWATMESSLFQDGKPPTTSKGAYSRITHFNRKGQTLAQYAYRLDPIPARFSREGNRLSAGLSDILALDAQRLLVIERLFSLQQGAMIKFYEINIADASDILSISTLKKHIFSPVSKRLLFTLDSAYYPHVDNIEGISWGPILENGHASLVLVSDNNFDVKQQIQFFVFEVIPPAAL